MKWFARASERMASSSCVVVRRFNLKWYLWHLTFYRHIYAQWSGDCINGGQAAYSSVLTYIRWFVFNTCHRLHIRFLVKWLNRFKSEHQLNKKKNDKEEAELIMGRRSDENRCKNKIRRRHQRMPHECCQKMWSDRKIAKAKNEKERWRGNNYNEIGSKTGIKFFIVNRPMESTYAMLLESRQKLKFNRKAKKKRKRKRIRPCRTSAKICGTTERRTKSNVDDDEKNRSVYFRQLQVGVFHLLAMTTFFNFWHAYQNFVGHVNTEGSNNNERNCGDIFRKEIAIPFSDFLFDHNSI